MKAYNVAMTRGSLPGSLTWIGRPNIPLSRTELPAIRLMTLVQSDCSYGFGKVVKTILRLAITADLMEIKVIQLYDQANSVQ